MDQPGKVANPARGQLNRENNIPLSACVPENLVSRDMFSRPVPRQPAHLNTQFRLNLVSIYETVIIRHRVSPEFISGHAIAYRWRSLPRYGIGGKREVGNVNKACCLLLSTPRRGIFAAFTLIPPKRVDIFPPLTGGCSEGLGAFCFSLKTVYGWGIVCRCSSMEKITGFNYHSSAKC